MPTKSTFPENALSDAALLAISEKMSDAVNKLRSTADYVRQHGINCMMTDAKRVVKSNPGLSLLVAGVIGLLVGRKFASNT